MAGIRASLVVVVLASFPALLCAQNIPLINSGEVIRRGVALYDSGAYEEAISTFRTVPARDTNYVYMLSELALTCNAAEQYDEAIKICREAIQQPGEYKAHFMRTLGTAYDHKGDFEQSVATFAQAIAEFPFEYLLHYNLGITYYNHKDYDKAVECFINTLQINPFHGGSHLNLGVLSAFRGHKTRAMMSLGMYLAIHEEDNARLLLLERLLNNELREEGSIAYTGDNPFEKLDKIIRARVVADKSFEPKVPVNAMLVRQYQLLLDQLALAGDDAGDFWVKFYLPLYKGIHEKELLEPFLYHILSSSAFKEVAKWTKKNEKKLDEFFAHANSVLKESRRTRTLPEAWGFENPATCWYTDGNNLSAIGHEDAAGAAYGKWTYYSANGVCVAAGDYDRQGNKTGTWKYYHKDGALKSVENYETGEMQVFDDQGNPKHRYFLKDDKIDGEVSIFYPCGLLKEKLPYADGRREGGGKTFYVNGATETVYHYKANVLEGPYTIYFEDGTVQKKFTYKADTLDGAYEEYFGNGRLRKKGSYHKGEWHGVWHYYYSNGKPEKSGEYKDGELQGKWTFYDTRGHLIEERTYDEAGELHGANTTYHEDKVHHTDHYSHGRLVKVAYFDRQGKEVGTYGDPSGTFAMKLYYPDGRLYAEGACREGKARGEWKYYYPEGMLKKKCMYDDGELQGTHTEYFRSGKIKTEQEYAAGELHGYHSEHYSHGQVKEEGWYQHGEREQQWLAWHPDGSLESDSYYLNGYLTGPVVDYHPGGKILSSIEYDEGRIQVIRHFDRDGELRLGRELSGRKELIAQQYTGGKDHTRMELTCGEYTGDVLKWWPDGKPYTVISVSSGLRHGKYRFYYPGGQVDVEGYYMYGTAEGPWTWYFEDGKRSCEGHYLDGERDSTWTYYARGGKKTLEGRYEGGKRCDVFKIYGPDGILVLEKRYDRGDLLAYRTLQKDGKLSEWKTFNGNDAIRAAYANGNKAHEETYKNGMLEGAQHTYYENGQLYDEYNYSAGDYSGVYAVYYPDGTIMEKGAYKFDELDGTREYYNPDGTLRLTETYAMGVKSGRTVLYKKGMKTREISFWAGNIE